MTDDEILVAFRATFPVGPHLFTADATKFARAIIAAHTAKLLAGVEMPNHPEPHTYRWSRLEEEAIKQYAAAAALNARREALEEAKGVCVDLMAPPSVGCIANANIYHDATEDCAAAIEELKGKV